MNYRLLSALACATVASAFLEPIQHDFRKPGPLDSSFCNLNPSYTFFAANTLSQADPPALA